MSNLLQQKPIILASGSEIRQKLLSSLGLSFSVIPSLCDEEAIKRAHKAHDFITLGFDLASAKALAVNAKLKCPLNFQFENVPFSFNKDYKTCY